MDAGRIDTNISTLSAGTPASQNESVEINNHRFILREQSSYNFTLSEQDQTRLDSMQKTLETLRSIPAKIAKQEAEFNQKYIDTLKDRLELLENLGPIANPADFLAISKEAVRIARQTLSTSDISLAPSLETPDLLETLIQIDRDGANATIRLNTLTAEAKGENDA